MKKNLTLLTVVVFLISILVAGGCNRGTKQNSSPEEENGSAMAADVSNKVEVTLKDTSISGRMHLVMYNENHKDKKKIDSLETVVHRGDYVVFKNADSSNIWKVYNMRVVEGYPNIFKEIGSEDKSLYKLEILTDAPDNTTVKYEIVFAVKDDEGKETTWCIDPYLKIPDQ